jgi:hypothetical protein
LTGFLGEFFEPSQPKSIELEVDPDLWSGTEEQVEECRRRACAAFGRPAGDWTWHFGMDKHKEAIDFIVAGHPWPGGSTSPLHLSFNYDLRWKPGVLPREVWLEPYSDEPKRIPRLSSVIVYLQNRCFASTMFLIPIPVEEPGAFDFLHLFSRAAPFKMNPKHFRLSPRGARGRRLFSKPDEVMSTRLEEALK